LQNGQTLFHQHFEIWTNNIGEFLAIVHALAHFHPAPQTIYSDSKIAINRIHQKICKSKFKTTHTSRQVRQAVEKAEHRLQTHKLSATLLKRNTKERGEIPADFNRK
jgi:ribonuclease HI